MNRTLNTRALMVFGVTLLAGLAGPAQANFCKLDTTDRARDEAKQLESETFAAPYTDSTVDYVGDREYNADIITCNRKRDQKSGRIEREAPLGERFSSTLPPRTIKGHYTYYSTASLRYAYELSRENGEWKLRIPMEFDWPDSRMTDMIDISGELVAQLNDATLNSLCSPSNAKLDKDGKTVLSGFIPQDLGNAAGKDAVAGGTACRVKRNLEVADKSILAHLKEFYRQSITRAWNRPGFTVEPVIIGTDKASQAELNAWRTDETIWKLQLNLDPSHRASFKRWLFKWNHMYTGSPSAVIAHEFGHIIGLDDEYGWGPAMGPRDCDNKDSTAQSNYIMCSQWASSESDSTTDDDVRNGAKAVYVWLVTQRYGMGKEYACKEDGDCSLDEYCGKHGLDRNVCEQRRDADSECSSDKQCVTGLSCLGKPLGRCEPESTQALGEFCVNDKHCISGSCTREFGCQCKDRGDCGAGRYCDTGTLEFGHNTCKAFKAEGDTCSNDKQCAPPATCGGFPPTRCIVEASKTVGQACKKNAECMSGQCEKDVCVCSEDRHCAEGQTCLKPVGAQNYCSDNLALGFRCDRDGQCASGKCDKNKCVCTEDGQCPGKQTCKKPIGGANYCTDDRGLGSSCARDSECASGKCEDRQCVCDKDSDCGKNRQCKRPITKKNYCE